ncbi:MAG: response regulator [Limisphaerales bacterium]
MRVMIVDDSSDVRQLIRETLAPWNHEIIECADGDEAVERYSEFLPDWTLMDFRMPRTDGLTAIRHLRDRWPSARILLLTSYDSAPVRKEALRLGASSCLSKDRIYELPECLGDVLHPPAPGPIDP